MDIQSRFSVHVHSNASASVPITGLSDPEERGREEAIGLKGGGRGRTLLLLYRDLGFPLTPSTWSEVDTNDQCYLDI